jgi:hypothetical protein
MNKEKSDGVEVLEVLKSGFWKTNAEMKLYKNAPGLDKSGCSRLGLWRRMNINPEYRSSIM